MPVCATCPRSPHKKQQVARSWAARGRAGLCPPTQNTPPSLPSPSVLWRKCTNTQTAKNWNARGLACLCPQHARVPPTTYNAERHEHCKDFGCNRTRCPVPAACPHSKHTSLLSSPLPDRHARRNTTTLNWDARGLACTMHRPPGGRKLRCTRTRSPMPATAPTQSTPPSSPDTPHPDLRNAPTPANNVDALGLACLCRLMHPILLTCEMHEEPQHM